MIKNITNILLCIALFNSIISSAQEIDSSTTQKSFTRNPIDQQFTKFPESRFKISVGGYLVFINSTVQLGLKALGGGISIDTEKALGLETEQRIGYAEFRVGLGKKLRHTIEIGIMSSRRSGYKTIINDLTIGDIYIPAYTSLETEFNFNAYRVEYLYSLVKDRRAEVQLGFGFFIMPIDFAVTFRAPGIGVQTRTGADITAPLPVLGMQLEIPLAPSLFLFQKLYIMYMKIGPFKGDIIDFQLSMEYRIIKNLGVGAGWHRFDLSVTSEDDYWPGVDLIGQIEFSYSGPFLYAIVYF